MERAAKLPAEIKRPSRRKRWLAGATIAVSAILAIGLAGFVAFSRLINEEPGAAVQRADAIVVLTGGEARIPEAIKLLAQGKGRRLLISGVNPITTRKELASLMPNSQRWFRCCIDVDYVARDTIGNATETRSWVDKRGFKSLIVVTASYHMPRSLAELRRALPDTRFIPYPVKPGNLHMETWWTHPPTLRFLAIEYIKFLPAFGRCLAIQIGLNRGLYGGSRQCLNAQS
ncbi:MAG: YdcF family protein [Rhodomicrobium sp.]|nr:YdcF family protein [Rhodomicrobium sp.]